MQQRRHAVEETKYVLCTVEASVSWNSVEDNDQQTEVRIFHGQEDDSDRGQLQQKEATERGGGGGGSWKGVERETNEQ